MKRCMQCGGAVVYLSGGGCGGRGSLHGCEKCDVVYEQTTGGFLPTYGGEQYERRDDIGLKEQRYYLAQQIKPFQVNWGDGHRGQWAWSEVGYGETHYFPDKAQAQQWLDIYIKQLDSQLPYPYCDKCGKRAERYGLTAFLCRPCGRRTFRDESRWYGDEE